MITLDTTNVLSFIDENQIAQMEPQVKLAHDMLHKKSGPGNSFIGWLDLPSNYDKEEFLRIRKAAAKIRKKSGKHRKLFSAGILSAQHIWRIFLICSKAKMYP